VSRVDIFTRFDSSKLSPKFNIPTMYHQHVPCTLHLSESISTSLCSPNWDENLDHLHWSDNAQSTPPLPPIWVGALLPLRWYVTFRKLSYFIYETWSGTVSPFSSSNSDSTMYELELDGITHTVFYAYLMLILIQIMQGWLLNGACILIRFWVLLQVDRVIVTTLARGIARYGARLIFTRCVVLAIIPPSCRTRKLQCPLSLPQSHTFHIQACVTTSTFLLQVTGFIRMPNIENACLGKWSLFEVLC
jgi:hypothetical protein